MLKKTDNSLKDRIKVKVLLLVSSFVEAIIFCNAIVMQAYASASEVEAKVDASAISVYGLIKAICLSLIVVVLAVCGLILIIGTQKMKEAVKENFYYIAIGVAILFFAQEITGYIEETFGCPP